MPSVRVNIDERTPAALNRVAPRGERAKFMRQAIRNAIMAELARQSRAGYAAHPDSESEPDDWSTAEKYRR